MTKHRVSRTACSMLLCLALVMSAFIAVPPQSASADTIDNVVAEMQKTYNFLKQDPVGKEALNKAKNNVKNLSDADSVWGNVVDSLLTVNVNSKLGTDAKAKLISLIKGAAEIQYASDSADLRTNLNNFKTGNQDTVTGLFGDDLALDFIYAYLTAARDNIPEVIVQDPSSLLTLFSGDYSSIRQNLKDWSIAALNKAETEDGYSDIAGKLTSVNWNHSMLIDAMYKLGAAVDSDNSAQIALMKAYVRSAVSTNPIEISLLAGEIKEMKDVRVSAFGYSIPGNLLKWKIDNADVAEYTDGTKSLKAKNSGTATLTAYRENIDTDWICKVKVSVTSGGGTGGGGGGVLPTPPVQPLPEDNTQANQQIQQEMSKVLDLVKTDVDKAAAQLEAIVNSINEAKTEMTAETMAQMAQTVATVVETAGQLAPTAVQTTENGSYMVDETAALAQVNKLSQVFQNMQQLMEQLNESVGAEIQMPAPVLTVQAQELDADNKVQVTIPAAVFNNLSAITGEAALQVDTPAGTLILPAAAVGDAAGSVQVSFQVAETPTVGLENSSVAGMTVDVNISVSNTSGTNNINGFTKPVTLSIPYVAGQVRNPAHLGVYKLLDGGKVIFVGGRVLPDGTVAAHLNSLSTYTVLEYSKTFADIVSHWAKSDIEKMASRHVVKGINETDFAPNIDVTRAEFAALVVRSLGIDEVTPTGNVFSDVAKDAWYAAAVETASARKIVDGIGGGKFAPSEKITREQMAVLATRALKLTGKQVVSAGVRVDEVLKDYTDRTMVSGWAKQGTAEAVDAGIIKGRAANVLAPKGMTTRAEATVMLKNIIVAADIY